MNSIESEILLLFVSHFCFTFCDFVSIPRKTIEGYLNSFDYITFEKIISKQSIFVSDKTTNMQFSKIQKKTVNGSLVMIQYHTNLP